MGKRIRSDHSSTESDGASSTESREELITLNNKVNGATMCSHITRAVELSTVLKKIQSGGFDRLCCRCTKEAVIHSAYAKELDGAPDRDGDCTLWMCLKCGTQLCGRSRKQHALQHSTQADMHELAMNTSTFTIWCYCCQFPVDPYATPMLLEIVEFGKRRASRSRGANGFNDASARNGQLMESIESVRNMMIDSPPHSTPPANNTIEALPPPPPPAALPAIKPNDINPGPGVSGLYNIGNTCYFNAVLQCLARTPFLLPILNESAVDGEKVVIPGGTLKLPDGSEMLLEPIVGELEAWRKLTGMLADVLTKMTTSTQPITPSRLLGEVVSKWPQFRAGHQQDSHELLRHLLESVRTDDLRRYQALILHTLGFGQKDKSYRDVDETRKAMLRFYGDQIAQWVFRPEQVFRGSLVSTLTCQECQHTSSRHEYFLDISLPVVCVENQQPPALGQYRKEGPEPHGMLPRVLNAEPAPAGDTPKQPLSKKEREREKKARRIAKHQKNRINLTSVGGISGDFPGLTANTASAISDNADTVDMPPMRSLIDDVATEGRTESSDDSNALSDADVEDNDVMDDGAVDHNGNQSSRSVPEKLDEAPENPNKEPEGGSNIVCAISVSAHRAARLQLQLLATGKTALAAAAAATTEEAFLKRRAAATSGRQPGTRQRTNSHADWSNTIAPRYQCGEGECSVQSCLNSFTAVELMSGNNKVCCEACTERINGKDGKSVNTNATKQFLISVPPAVLILHLKRFQVGPRGIFKKISKPVSFPFVLDIAPFCGSKVKRASHVRPDQKKILYALYGVVEHTGTMSGGHYVAYVKVRPPFGPDDERWKFIPTGTKDELDSRSEHEMAKEQAKRMGFHLRDSDDSLSSAQSDSEGDDTAGTDGSTVKNHSQQQQQRKRPNQLEQNNDDDEEEEEEEGAVGYTPKVVSDTTPEVEPPPGKWYYVSDRDVHEVKEENVLNAEAYLLFYERIF
ncbi:AGAP000666-PA-like protein [Anopheles sinensis]|uniref:Ubiquitin carboxyl-terminal hydrolase n=1 Tax=Anopheles sinensis TaxID=74873 RepID=A0A084VVM0_ANOSI|nr:AGAP000666-PA-like protein [Anopheles sinensis]